MTDLTKIFNTNQHALKYLTEITSLCEICENLCARMCPHTVLAWTLDSAQ